MDKISLQQLIDEDLLEVPAPDVMFMLGDVTGDNYLNLSREGGVYFFTYNDEVIYVGVSINLGKRMYDHSYSRVKNGLTRKLIEECGSAAKARDIVDETKVSIIFEERLVYQDIYEKYLIGIHDPKYNYESKRETRGGSTQNTLSTIELRTLVEDYVKGDTMFTLTKRYTMSASKVRKTLVAAGIEIRAKGGTKKSNKISVEEVLAERSAGMTLADIAYKRGCSPSTIYGLIKKHPQKVKTA